MSRWGQEEKKTQGLFGFFFALAVTGLFTYTAYLNYYNLEGRRLLENEMQNIIRSGLNATEEEMRRDIRQAAIDLALPLGPDDLELVKYLDDTDNWTVECKIAYTVEIDYLIGSHTIDFPISENVQIVIF